MENDVQSCPVCTLYLRPGISLKEHLTSHPKQKVIEALVKLSNCETDRQITPATNIQPSTSQQWNLPINAQPIHANHSFIYQQFMSSTTPQPNVLGVNHLGQQYVTIPTVFNPQMMCHPYVYQQQQVFMSSGQQVTPMPKPLSIDNLQDQSETIIQGGQDEEQVILEGKDNSKKEEVSFELENDIKETVIIQGDAIINPDEIQLINGNSIHYDINAVTSSIELEPAPSISEDLNKSCQTSHNENDIFIDEDDTELCHGTLQNEDDVDLEEENAVQSKFEEDQIISSEPTTIPTTNYITLISHEEAMAGTDENVAQQNLNTVDMDGMNLMINSEDLQSVQIAPIEDYDYVCEYDQADKIIMNIHDYTNENHEIGDESVSVDSTNIRADEHMPPRGELSGQESNASDVPWSRMQYHEGNSATSSYNDINVLEAWDGSDVSNGEVPPLQSRVLPACERDEGQDDDDDDVPTVSGYSNSAIQYKCSSCGEIFCTVKERSAHHAERHVKEEREEEEMKIVKKKVKKLTVKTKKAAIKTENTFDNVFTNRLKVEESKSEVEAVKLEVKSMVVVNPTVCTICDAILTDNNALKQHLADSHNITNEEKYKCNMCKEVFASESKYTAHLAIHPLECRLCGKYFYRRQNLQLHMKRHLGIRPYKCTVCDKSFLTRQKLEEHKNIHTGDSPIKCNLCDEAFRRHSNLVQHKNRHHFNMKRKVKDYICSCGDIFHSKRKLAWHKEVHENKPKSCAYCSAKFVHASSLTRHVRRAHNDRFVPKEERSNENVECPICNGIFLRASLDVHIKNHSGVRQFRCLICNKDFTTKWNLKLHKWTHAARAAKPFKCDLCKGAFIRETDYIAHMNSHKSIRPYTCNYCGAQFNRKYNCQRHVKEHIKVKNFNCQICGKSFHRSYYLKDHMRIHSGDRPFTCHICGKSSNSKSNHNKHVKTHHAREPVSTEI